MLGKVWAPSRRGALLLEPVISCRVTLPEGTDPHTALAQLRQLEQEDPQLHLEWEEQKREIQGAADGRDPAGDFAERGHGALRAGHWL